MGKYGKQEIVDGKRAAVHATISSDDLHALASIFR
jgi:hypothetical protein